MKSISREGNSKQKIRIWINDLGGPNDKERIKARSLLISEGVNAVPGLIQALSNGNQVVRREAAKIFAQTGDSTAASALVHALEDEDHDVRWAAMETLIALDRAGLEPLLQSLNEGF